MLKNQIIERLEQAFSQHGFAEPSVAQLKTECGVSLRTLYKHFPSKEEMIIAALDHRHQRYLNHLLQDLKGSGADRVRQIFDRLDDWMGTFAPNGCMSLNAMATFPDNDQIRQAVARHKLDVRHLLGQHSERPELATQLLLLHESISSTWPVIGQESISIANTMAQQLLRGEIS